MCPRKCQENLPFFTYEKSVVTKFNPFLLSTYTGFIKSLQEQTLENIATKEEIAHNEQFLLLPQCLQPFSIIILSFYNDIQ